MLEKPQIFAILKIFIKKVKNFHFVLDFCKNSDYIITNERVNYTQKQNRAIYVKSQKGNNRGKRF